VVDLGELLTSHSRELMDLDETEYRKKIREILEE
jgi:hypothetical protein